MPVSDVATLADPRQFVFCTSLHFNRHLSFFFFFAFAWIYFTKPTLLLMDVLHASLVVLILRLAVKIIREKRNSFFPTRSLCSILSPLLFVAVAAAMLVSVLPRLPSLLRYWVSLWVSHCDSECWLQRCQHNCSLFGLFFCTSSFWTIFSIGIAIGQKTQCVLLKFFCEAELSKEFQLNPQTLWIDKQQVILPFFFSFSWLRSWHFFLTF